MCVGFALGHLAPAPFSKESLHEAVDVGGADVFGDVADFLESLVVMLLDGVRTTLEIREGMAVRGQRKLDTADLTDSIEGVEEGFERIGEVRNAADMRSDRGQDMIASQERAGLGIMQADVIGGMARRVKYEPFSAGQFDDIAVFDVVCDRWKEFAAPEGGEVEPSQSLSNLASLRWALPGGRRGDPLEGAKEVSQRVLCAATVALEQLHVNGQIVDRRFAVMIVGTVHMRVPMRVCTGVAFLFRGAPEMKGPMGHDFGAGLLVDTYGTPEMIGVRMGNEDGVDVAGLEASLPQAMQDRIPGGGSGETRVDQGGAVIIDQCVHVHMAQPGNDDRQLHAKNVLRDLADLFAGVFLLLSLRSAHDARL